MAEASNNKYSCFLFTEEDGSPIKFRMTTPCPEKSRLRPLIEAGGGQLTGKESPSTINLIPPTTIAKSSNLVCSAYIDDCIKENKLLDNNNYSVLVGSQYISRMDQNQNSLTVQSRSRSGRHNFLHSEDINIIRYLLEEESLKHVNGVKLWQMMESLKIVNHTWQSTKDHFLKIILPNIKQYRLTPGEVEKFQNIGKPAKGSDGQKRAAKFPLEYAGTAKDVEEEDKEVEEDVSQDEDVDEFDQNLVQIAKSSEKAVANDNGDTVGKRKLGEDADSDEGDEVNLLSKDGSSGAQLADKDEKKRVKGLKGPKKIHVAADDGNQEQPPSAGLEKPPDSSSTTKVHSVETSNALGNADMQEVQNTGEGLTLRNAIRVGVREMKTQCNKAKKTCTAEIAIADSQNADRDEESDFPRQKYRLTIDSSTELETDVESEEVFPLVYSGRRYGKGQKEKEVASPGRKGDSSSKTTNKRSASSPQPCTSKQIPQEVSKKPKKSLGQCSGKLQLRDFVMNDSIRENTPEDASSAGPADFNAQTDMQSIEKCLTTCDKLMTWLSLSPEIFVQAVYQCNGSVDCAIAWLLDGSGKIWQPNDDSDLFSGIETKLKVLQEKYGKEFVAERQNYLTENPAFL